MRCHTVANSVSKNFPNHLISLKQIYQTTTLNKKPPQKKKHNPRVGKGWEMWLQKSSADFLSLNAITVVNNSAEKDTDEH